MAPKRAASTPPRGRGRPPKAAKVAEPEQQATAASPKKRGRPSKGAKVAEPEQEEEIGLQFVSDLLSEFSNVSSDCADMLKAALPHALGSSERHAFQKTVIDSFTGICTDAEKEVAAKVKAAEERITSLDSERLAGSEKLAEAEQATRDKAEAKVAAENAEKEAETTLAAAQAAVQAAKDTLTQAEKDAQAQDDAKAAFEQAFAENFEALKTGKYAGKEWPLRNKAIKNLTALLEQASAPKSLVAAAQLVFKDKPEARSSFGAVAVDSVEETAKEHVETMAKGIEQQQEVVTSQRQAVATAEEAAAIAQQNLEVAQNTMISAENAWLESDAAAKDVKKALQELEQADPAAELDSASASLERLRGLVKSFEELRDPKAQAPMEEPAEGKSLEEV